ncbi:MAG: hypothetical protein PHG42_09520 [Bacteroides sp.]|nr:hypothetical protein [Bacteroides sp.]NLI63342.1 hypothetical protein [Bacteroidales bacterium]
MKKLKNKITYILFFTLLFISLSSCSTLLDLASTYDECSYAGCSNKARSGSAYCAHHDYNLMKNNLNKTFERISKDSQAKNKK